MPYIQITTRCNMRCAHCCFACTEVGEDMTLETWENVKEKILYGEESVCIGGGEPTLHKEFNTILMDCIADIYDVCIITNGTVTKRALLLAKLTKNNIIHAELSVDDWHDLTMVDNEVISAFEKLNAIRTVKHIDPAGRAIINEEATEETGCGCQGLIVRPNGDVYQCNCPDATCFGNVNDDDFSLENCVDCCMRELSEVTEFLKED